MRATRQPGGATGRAWVGGAEYRHTPAIFTQFVGWVERLTSGNTFIGWGAARVLQEVAPDKSTVWEARVPYNGVPSAFYRAMRLPDLYTHRAP